MSLLPNTNIPLVDRSIRWHFEDDYHVLVIERALYNSETHCYHDIRIERPLGGTVHSFTGLWGSRSGDKFDTAHITETNIRKIQQTYSSVLKTIGHRPGQEGVIKVDLNHTEYKDSSGSVQTGYASDMRSAEKRRAGLDTPSKIHNMVVEGILTPLGKGSIVLSSKIDIDKPLSSIPVTEGGALSHRPPAGSNLNLADFQRGGEHFVDPKDAEIVASRAKNPVSGWPADLNKWPEYWRAPSLSNYANKPDVVRKKMLIEQLDKAHPIPFSAFALNNEPRQIKDEFFNRLKQSLERIAQNPDRRGAPIGRDHRTKEQKEDDEKMWKVLERWNEAAYIYLLKNGGNLLSKPGLSKGELNLDAKEQVDLEEKRFAEAWKGAAPWRWIPHLCDSLSSEKINISQLADVFVLINQRK